MIKAKNLLLSLALVSTGALSSEKIVGGEVVSDVLETNFAVSFNGSCAGSIINKKWVLSAAHCAAILPNGATAGVLNNTNPNATRLKVKNVIVHPKYSENTFDYDYALVELDSEIALNGHNIDAIKIADQNFDAQGFQAVGVDAVAYGWGRTEEWGPASDDILKVVVPIVSNATAAAANIPYAVTDSMIAAGIPEGGKDACQGDSGGPLISYNNQSEPVLIGVVSWGIGCARKNRYGVYSKVSHVADWIKGIVKH